MPFRMHERQDYDDNETLTLSLQSTRLSGIRVT